MWKWIPLITGILLSLSVKNTSAQVLGLPYFQEQAHVGMNFLYDLDYFKAKKIFTTLQQKYPQDPAPHFLKALNTWWRISISRDFRGYDQEFLTEIDSALYKCAALEKKPAARLEYVFLMFNTLAFKGRYYAMREEWFQAAQIARKCVPYLMEGRKFQDQSVEFDFSIGLYEYFAVYFPEKHPVTRPFMVFFPTGNKIKGIALLEKAQAGSSFSRNEALFFLMRIYVDDEPNPSKALVYAKELVKRYPKNTVYQVYLAQTLLMNRDIKQAKIILENYQTQFEQLPNYDVRRYDQIHNWLTSQVMQSVYYYLGKIRLIEEKNVMASIPLFRKAEILSGFCVELDPIVKEGIWYYSGRALLAAGKTEAANTYFRKVHKDAETETFKAAASACLKGNCPTL
jgi:hypothetical protein